MDDFFPEIFERPDAPPPSRGRGKKKTDFAALQSPFMRVPYMRIEVARGFLDMGIRQLYELQGRSPEALFEQLKAKSSQTVWPTDTLAYIRLAVYCADHTDAQRDRDKLHPHAWTN